MYVGVLQPLIGRTRASVLAAAGRGVTTSQLIMSGRRRNTMVHTLTPLGAGLVSAAEAMRGL